MKVVCQLLYVHQPWQALLVGGGTNKACQDWYILVINITINWNFLLSHAINCEVSKSILTFQFLWCRYLNFSAVGIRVAVFRRADRWMASREIKKIILALSQSYRSRHCCSFISVSGVPKWIPHRKAAQWVGSKFANQDLYSAACNSLEQHAYKVYCFSMTDM